MDIFNVAEQMKNERKTIFDLDIRVTFYARVSTLREEQENSIEHQVSYFTELINNNPHWTYVEGYVDRVRGESAANREQFMKMIEDGKSGAFDLVITKEVSRFARNTIDSLTYTRELLRAGIGVFFQNDNICTIDTDCELRLSIMSSIAADEVRKLSERVRWGHKRSIESGVVMGNSRIFGYDKKDGKLVINDNEAEMIKLIFDLYSKGDISSRKLEDILYEKGYRGRNGTRIHHNTINGILQNPKYKGYYCGNKVKIVDYRTKEQRFLPEDEWIMYKDETGEVVPAIVDEELWDKCFEIFKSRSDVIKSRTRSIKTASPLSGKIWCGVHEKPYWRTSYSNSVSQGQPIYQWLCSEKKRSGAKACSSFSLLEDEIYMMISEHFKDIAENLEDYIKTFLTLYEQTGNDKSVEKAINELTVRLDKETLKRDKLLELYMDGIIKKEEFSKRNEALSQVITEIEEAIKEYTEKNKNDSTYADDLRKIEKYLKNNYNPDVPMSHSDTDELVRAIVDRVDIYPVNAEEVRFEIKLKTGKKDAISYIRKGDRYGRRSGHICKKMIDAYKMQ